MLSGRMPSSAVAAASTSLYDDGTIRSTISAHAHARSPARESRAPGTSAYGLVRQRAITKHRHKPQKSTTYPNPPTVS